jgi:hypothetical protein
MSNDTSGLPGIVTVLVCLNTSSADAKLGRANNAATAAAEDASFNVLLSKRRDSVHMRNLPGLFEFQVKSNIATFQPYGLFQQIIIKFL